MWIVTICCLDTEPLSLNHTQVNYDGSDHTLIRDEDILLMYSGDEMTLDAIEPAWDRIIVKVESSSEETASGIVVAPTGGAGASRASEGQVVAVGKGRMASNGERTSMDVAVGEFVKFRDYAGAEVRIQGLDYIVVKAGDCLAKWL